VQKVRETAGREQTKNNLKQIALAFHNHIDTNGGQLPSPKMQKNPQNPPVELSWRVSLLPYLDAMALANRFDPTKGWDHPANQPLMNPMPKVYTDILRDPPNPSTNTFLQQFTGPNTLWPDNNMRRFPAAIPDGTSNTFLVAEAATSVPWTKPADIVVQPNQPLPLPADRFLVAFGDASVRIVDHRRVNDNTLRLYINPADGMPVPPLD
jgi:hypothetical protein